MRLEELGDILEGKFAIRRMIVSFFPNHVSALSSQRIKQRVLDGFPQVNEGLF